MAPVADRVALALARQVLERAAIAEQEASAAIPEAIDIGQRAFQHVVRFHTVLEGSEGILGKSAFIGDEEEVQGLIANAAGVVPFRQADGALQWIVDAGRNIGMDRVTGALTTTYTVITDSAGRLITAYPGLAGR